MLHWFRRHAKILMVVLGSAAMAIFGLGPVFDTLASRGRGDNGPENEVVAEWKGGEITRVDLRLMEQRHFQVQRFMQALQNAAQQKKGDVINPMVAPIAQIRAGNQNQVDEQLIFRFLMAERAKMEGVIVSDGMVNDYLTMLAGDVEFSNQDLKAINDEVNNRYCSVQAIREHMKMELLSNQMQAFAMAGVPYIPNPTESMELYARSMQQIECEVLPIDVETYVDKVTDTPPVSELKKLYEQGKNDFPDLDGKDPGFKIGRKMNVQYFVADFDTFLQNEMNQLKVEEIQAEYDRLVAEKDNLVMEPLAPADNSFDLNPTDPTPEGDPAPSPPGSGLNPPSDVSPPPTTDEPSDVSPPPSESTTPEGGIVEPMKEDPKPEPPKSEPPTEEIPKTDPPKTEPPKTDPPKTDPPKTDPPKTDPPKTDPPKTDPPKTDPPKTDPPKTDPPKTDPPKTDPPKGEPEGGQQESGGSSDPDGGKSDPDKGDQAFNVSQRKSHFVSIVTQEDPKQEDPKEEPAQEDPVETKKPDPPSEQPPTPPTSLPGQSTDAPQDPLNPTTEPKPPADLRKPKPLKDVVEDVKRAMSEDAARKAMEKALLQAGNSIQHHYEQRISWEHDNNRGPEPAPVDFMAEAKLYNVEANETGMVNIVEIADTPIGQVRMFAYQNQQPTLVAVGEAVFADADPNLYEAKNVSDWASQSSYLYWVAEKSDARVPTFDEAKPEIIKFWKQQKALEMALAEAESVKAKLNAAPGKKLSEFYPAKAVQTGAFTWFSSFGNSSYSSPMGVTQAGEAFMETAFSLKQLEAGVATNASRDSVYVVQAITPQPPIADAGMEFLKNYMYKPRGPNEVARASQHYGFELTAQWQSELREALKFDYVDR